MTLLMRLRIFVFFIGIGLYLIFTIVTPQLHIPAKNKSKRIDMTIDNVMEDVEKMKRILHGEVKQKLEFGHLPLAQRNETWYLWRNDTAGSVCRNYATRFGRDLPSVRLISFPRSGNSWIRYMLEGATGIFTGSLRNFTAIKKAGYLGEDVGVDNGLTIVQKTHAATSILVDLADLGIRYAAVAPHLPAVLILRNPAKAIMSYWQLYVTGDFHASLPEQQFKTDDFHEFVVDSVSKWSSIAIDRLLWSDAPVFIIHYEYLVVQPIKILRNLLAFLGVPVDEDRIACLSKHLTGSFKRQNKEHFDPYTPLHKSYMDIAATRVNRTLKLLGYQPLPIYNII